MTAIQDPTRQEADFGSQLTAANRSVEVDGATLVYRRFGEERSDVPPLLCLQHFRGNLDNWDPALVERLARRREMILLANRGVGASTGVVPDTVTEMARDVCASSTRSRSRVWTCSASRSAATSHKSSRSCDRGSSAESCSPPPRRKAAPTCTAGRTRSTVSPRRTSRAPNVS